jgi:hypothetical protein
MLLATAAAKLYSATGTAKVLDIEEALLPISIRQALWLVGFIEAAVALYLFFGKSEQIKLVCVAWLGGNFLLYRVAGVLLAVGKPCPCLGSDPDGCSAVPVLWEPLLPAGARRTCVSCSSRRTAAG